MSLRSVAADIRKCTSKLWRTKRKCLLAVVVAVRGHIVLVPQSWIEEGVMDVANKRAQQYRRKKESAELQYDVFSFFHFSKNLKIELIPRGQLAIRILRCSFAGEARSMMHNM